MPGFHIRPEAARDLDEIRRHIAENNPASAVRLIEEVIELFHRLAEFAMMGRSREELVPKQRSFPVGNYVIFYRPISDGVEIVRVLHGSRDIESLFER
jgi:toxin ParE1/3/4